MRWLKQSFIHALAVSLVATGCASPAPTEWVVHPAKPLPRAPHVIAEATPVDLGGFHLSDSEYGSYLAVRDARIDRAVSSTSGGGFGGGGGHPVLLIVAIPIYLIVLLDMKGRAHGNAADRDRLLERSETARLSPLLAKTATGAALAERTGNLVNPKLGETAGWLQVAVKSIEQRVYSDGRVALAIHAEAQAIAPDGAASPPSQHFVLIPPKDYYSLAWGGHAVEEELKKALDTLAESVASTYLPERFAAPAQRYGAQGDAKVVTYVPGLREFVRDYDAR